MGVFLDTLLYSDHYTGNILAGGTDTGTPYLIGNQDDSIAAVINFHVYWATVNQPMTFSSTGNTITRTDTGSFITDEFQQFDIISISGTSSNNGTFTISSLTDKVITTSTSLTSEIVASASIYGATPIKALDFYYNLIQNGNSPSYFSLSDNTNIQQTSANWTGSLPSNLLLAPRGTSKAWSSGSSHLTFNGISGNSQNFSIKHLFDIKPHFLAGQLPNFINNIPPAYYIGTNCLQHVFQINTRYSASDPTVRHASNITFPSSNTGWFNENLNGNDPGYTLRSVSYTDHASGNPVDAIDYTKPTDVVVTLNSINGTFTNSSPFQLGFTWMPNSARPYQNQPTNYAQCFHEDTVLTRPLSGSTNGGNFGTGYQVFTNCIASAVTPYIATLTSTIDFGATTKALFASAGTQNSNYFIAAATQDPSISASTYTDRVSVICDVDSIFANKDNPSLFTVVTSGTSDILFFAYPNIGVSATTNYDGFVGDYAYALMDFTIPTGKILKDFSIYVIATNATGNTVGQEIILERWQKNTATYFDGTINQISINESRGFYLPSGSIQNSRSLNRKASLDTPGSYGYEMVYGFQSDYRYNLQLNGIPVPFNLTNWSYWATYSNQPGWATKFKMVANVSDPATNSTTQFVQYANMTIEDISNNLSGTTITINTYDTFGNNFYGNIAKNQQTEVVVTFNSFEAFGSFPVGFTAFQAQLYLNYFNGKTNILDMDDTESNPLGLWVGRPVINQISDSVIEVSGILNPSPNIVNYKLMAKLGYK